MAKKSDHSLFINLFFNSLKELDYSLFLGSHYSLFIIFWLTIHYKKGHYSLIIIPHPDPLLGDSSIQRVYSPLSDEFNQVMPLGKNKILLSRPIWP